MIDHETGGDEVVQFKPSQTSHQTKFQFLSDTDEEW